MTPDEHRAKAAAIERSLERCTPADYETVIEACMLAGTHWFNIALHDAGVLPPERDAMHAEFLSGAERRKARIHVAAALTALDEIEALRTPFVRGDFAGGEAAARKALTCLTVLRASALREPIR
jgi:hypothetical protein